MKGMTNERVKWEHISEGQKETVDPHLNMKITIFWSYPKTAM